MIFAITISESVLGKTIINHIYLTSLNSLNHFFCVFFIPMKMLGDDWGLAHLASLRSLHDHDSLQAVPCWMSWMIVVDG